jgi:hypothetical protein
MSVRVSMRLRFGCQSQSCRINSDIKSLQLGYVSHQGAIPELTAEEYRKASLQDIKLYLTHFH